MEAQKVKLLQERDIRFQQASYHPRDVYFRNPFLSRSSSFYQMPVPILEPRGPRIESAGALTIG